MHYIKEPNQSNQLNKQEQLDKLLIEAYNFIKGESENNPTLRQIKAFLFALNNIWLPWMGNDNIDETT